MLATTSLLSLLPYFAMDVYTEIGPKKGAWTLVVFGMAFASIADAATGKAAFDAYRGGPSSPAGALRATLRRVWPVIASGVYRTVFALAGVAAFVVPGAYVFTVYALAPTIAVLEPELSASGTLKRSHALTHEAKWRALLCYTLPTTAAIAANVGMSQLVTEIVGAGHGDLAGGFAGSVTAVLLTPFLAGLQVILYLDCRVRSEALDLEWAFGNVLTSGVRTQA